MADEKYFPIRPTPDESKILAAEKDLLSYVVAFNVPCQKAFALWHPEFLDVAGKLTKAGRSACAQFFGYAKNREYTDAYKATLEAFFKQKQSKAEKSTEIDDTRKDRALKSLLNQAMSMVESGDTLDPDTLKVLTEIFKKLGILKDEVEVQEAPRRYIPTRCGECLYCSTIESYVKTGQIENACLRCRALATAKEHGFRYDLTRLLNTENNETTD